MEVYGVIVGPHYSKWELYQNYDICTGKSTLFSFKISNIKLFSNLEEKATASPLVPKTIECHNLHFWKHIGLVFTQNWTNFTFLKWLAIIEAPTSK